MSFLILACYRWIGKAILPSHSRIDFSFCNDLQNVPSERLGHSERGQDVIRKFFGLDRRKHLSRPGVRSRYKRILWLAQEKPSLVREWSGAQEKHKGSGNKPFIGSQNSSMTAPSMSIVSQERNWRTADVSLISGGLSHTYSEGRVRISGVASQHALVGRWSSMVLAVRPQEWGGGLGSIPGNGNNFCRAGGEGGVGCDWRVRHDMCFICQN